MQCNRGQCPGVRNVVRLLLSQGVVRLLSAHASSPLQNIKLFYSTGFTVQPLHLFFVLFEILLPHTRTAFFLALS